MRHITLEVATHLVLGYGKGDMSTFCQCMKEKIFKLSIFYRLWDVEMTIHYHHNILKSNN